MFFFLTYNGSNMPYDIITGMQRVFKKVLKGIKFYFKIPACTLCMFFHIIEGHLAALVPLVV